MRRTDYQKILDTLDVEIASLEAELDKLRKVRASLTEPTVPAPQPESQPPPYTPAAEPVNTKKPLSTPPLSEAEQRLQRARQKAAEEMATKHKRR